ncbi:hypothetical protein evm_005160 [Chilo suppressalis]|nr:hypothetical protein evm_005160 [Chilo suppressalis]
MAQSNNNQNQGLAPTTNRSVSIRADTTPSLALTQPLPLSFEGDLAKNFKTWLRQVELYMCANECHKKPSDTKAAILLHLLGEEGLDKFETFNLTEPEKNPKLRERLLLEPDLTLERCIEMCKTTEIATGYLHQLQEEDTQKIDKINKKHFNTNQQPKMFKCRSCGYEHSHRQCPAYGKMCRFCKKSNDFASVCRSKQWNAHKIKEIQQDEILLGSINTQDWTVQE